MKETPEQVLDLMQSRGCTCFGLIFWTPAGAAIIWNPDVGEEFKRKLLKDWLTGNYTAKELKQFIHDEEGVGEESDGD